MTEMLSKYLSDHFDAADTIENHQAMAVRVEELLEQARESKKQTAE